MKLIVIGVVIIAIALYFGVKIDRRAKARIGERSRKEEQRSRVSSDHE